METSECVPLCPYCEEPYSEHKSEDNSFGDCIMNLMKRIERLENTISQMKSGLKNDKPVWDWDRYDEEPENGMIV